MVSLWESPDVQRVLKLMFIIFLGKLLQGRFAGKEADVVQKLLLQFLVPATLFKGLSKETIELSHATFLGGGVVFVLVRTVASAVAGYGTFGKSNTNKELATMRRTSIFQISTTASALSVLPFLAAFLGPEWVGRGAIVDLPMKLYMLLVAPILLKMFGDGEGTGQGGGSTSEALKKILQDPITLSLIFGLLVAAFTGGGGTASLGFAGKAIDALAEGQTPVLFILIGLKLSFQSKTPLFCVVLLLATQGVLLLLVNAFVLAFNPDEEVAMFLAFFVQGAPSVVGMGVLKASVAAGVQGYDPDFAFDIVGLAFPISSLMQCSVGIVGKSYPSICGIIGLVLIAIAAALRIAFAGKFQVGTDAALINTEEGVARTNSEMGKK
jgi:hypothetical protein